MGYNVPILLITWRRPDTTIKVLNSLLQIKPRFLYIASDGPNLQRNGEKEKVLETRRIIDEMVNWECEIKKLYSDTNQGCRIGVTKAISWFFANEKMGIIMEDDIVAKKEFFQFCELNLNIYEKKRQIFAIGGFSPLERKNSFISMHGSVWGWATWKDRWQQYKEVIPTDQDFNYLKSSCSIFSILSWKLSAIQQTSLKPIDTWDYWWLFTRIRNKGFTILPPIALTFNCGISSIGSSHMVKKDQRLAKIMQKIEQADYSRINLKKDSLDYEDQLQRINDFQRLKARFGLRQVFIRFIKFKSKIFILKLRNVKLLYF